MRIPWAQLTHLSFHWSTKHQGLLEVLGQSTNLVNFSGNIFTCEDVSFDSVVPVHLPHLTSLELTVEGNYGPFIGYLTLPALKSFTLHCASASWFDDMVEWDHESFVSLLSRSSFVRDDISIPDMVLDGYEIEHLLRLLPSLQKVFLWWGKDFLIATFGKIATGTLLPNLTLLSMGLDRQQLSVAVDMVESRWKMDNAVNRRGEQVSRITSALFSGLQMDPDNEMEVARLDKYVEEGLEFLVPWN